MRTGTCRAGTWLRAAGRTGRHMNRGLGGLALQALIARPDAKFLAARAWWGCAPDRAGWASPWVDGCVSLLTGWGVAGGTGCCWVRGRLAIISLRERACDPRFFLLLSIHFMLIWCWQARWGAARNVHFEDWGRQRVNRSVGGCSVQLQTSKVALHALMLRRLAALPALLAIY